ncbi:MAG: GFA family protein [Aliishimia sp.]
MKGRCYCGEVQYEVNADPLAKLQCHCRECQYISGGGPNYAMLVPNAAFSYTQGAPKEFKRTDIEGARTRQFCESCGTHLTTILPGRGMTVVKVGTLDDPTGDYVGPDFAIFMKDAQPFHMAPADKPQYEGSVPPKQ